MYVGIILVAVATTMPEFVVSFSAMRRGSHSMAVGNLLGSNFFNLAILAFIDLVLLRGSIFRFITELCVFPAILGAGLTAIALGALLVKPSKHASRHPFAFDTGVIIALFIVGQYMLFQLTH